MGRMLAYVSAGAVVGYFGEAVFGKERPIWLSGLSLLVIALALVINGYRTFARKPLHFPTPRFIDKISASLWKALKISSMPKSVTAGAAGVLTVFLPCGHLYSFLIGAIATGSAIRGAGFMFAFWLGSAPLLSFGGIWIQKLLRPRIDGGQQWAGVLLIVAGLFSVASFAMRADSFAKQATHSEIKSVQPSEHESCHGMKM